MNKKIKKIKGKALLLALCLSLMSIAGCGGSNETSGNNETQAQTKQEMTTQESLSPKDMTVKEWLENLEIAGKKVGLPCLVKDLPDTVTLGDGYIIPGYGGVCDLHYNGQKVGTAHFNDMQSEVYTTINMKTGYENERITSLSFSRMDCFAVAKQSIKSGQTQDSIITLFGEP